MTIGVKERDGTMCMKSDKVGVCFGTLHPFWVLNRIGEWNIQM